MRPTVGRLQKYTYERKLRAAADAVERAVTAVRIAADVLAVTASEFEAAGLTGRHLARGGRECGKTAEVLGELARVFAPP